MLRLVNKKNTWERFCTHHAFLFVENEICTLLKPHGSRTKKECKKLQSAKFTIKRKMKKRQSVFCMG